MRISKRQWMTLIEVLIASSLLTILLTALLGIYYNVTVSYAAVQKVHEEAFKRRYMQNRLTQVFSNIPESWQSNLESIFFTSQDTQATKGPSLIFTFDGKTDLEPTFSGYTIGRLYLNQNHQLCFATWPGAKWRDRKPDDPFPNMKNEVLLDDVQTIAFRFYAAPSNDPNEENMPVDPQHLKPIYNSWDNGSWKHEYNQFPAMVHLGVTTGSGSVAYEYQFVLPYIQSTIEYKR